MEKLVSDPGFRVERVLVMELAGLGDNVHLLPALWLVRRQWPDAKLHVMVNSHVAGLFQITPWVDRVWSYPHAPRPGLAGNLKWAWDLRRERFDLLLNTSGSDRSSLLSFAAGARVGIGRRPADGGPPGWPKLFSRTIEVQHYAEPMFWQKWRFMRLAGIFGKPVDYDRPQFHTSIDPLLRRSAGIEEKDEGHYIHVSPFTTADARELPKEQVAELVAGLRANHPSKRIVISCAANDRERRKLAALLPLLHEPPWKVYDGTLSIATLAAVIQKAALNLSGDTGSLHLAAMTNTPAVAWFRSHKGEKEWIPTAIQYRVIIAEGGAPDALHGIDTNEVLAAVRELVL